MRKVLLVAALFVCMNMGTVLAAHWVPLIEGTERVPSVLFDVASMQKSENNLYFWEKIQRPDGSYELRFARVGIRDYEFSDAIMAEKAPSQNMTYLHPQEWDEHGANAHPLRLAWLDRVLVRVDEASQIGSDIDLVSVEVPEKF